MTTDDVDLAFRSGTRGPRQCREVCPQTDRHEFPIGRPASSGAFGRAQAPRRLNALQAQGCFALRGTARPPRRGSSADVSTGVDRHIGISTSCRSTSATACSPDVRRGNRCRHPLPDAAGHCRFKCLGYRPGHSPVAEAAADPMLSLPMFPHLTMEQRARWCNSLAKAQYGATAPPGFRRWPGAR